MFFSGEVVALVLYSFQQFGIMLGVGAETIILVVFLVSLRDGAVEPKEAQFARAIRKTLYVGLGIIIFSGVGITVYHALLGQIGIILQPAFLFKWLLVSLVLLAALARPRSSAFSHILFEGAVGGTWYALFLVHILAPVTTWPILLGLYGLWLLGFEAFWWALALVMHGGVEVGSIQPVPKPLFHIASKPAVVEKGRAVTALLVPKSVSAMAPAPRKPTPMVVPRKPFVMPAMPVPHKPTPAVVEVPSKPTGAQQNQDGSAVLPALHIMPRTPEDVVNQFRNAVVELEQ